MELNLKYPTIPQFAKLLSDICGEASFNISGLRLDYSVDSLKLVEKQIDSFSENGEVVNHIASTLFCFGCYLGELLIKHIGGKWVKTDDSTMKDLTPWPIVVEMNNGDCWNPIGKVFKRFEEGEREDLRYFYDIVKAGSK